MRLLVHVPAVPMLIYGFLCRGVKGDKMIRARVQQVAHRIDLHISRGAKVPYDALREFEFLTQRLRRTCTSVDAAIMWALGVYAVGRRKLHREYARGLGAPTLSDQHPRWGADLISSMKGRRSIRAWTQEEPDYADIQQIIDVAKWAPSSCNRQTWQAMVINRQEEKEFLQEYFRSKFWVNAPCVVLVLINSAAYVRGEKHYVYLDAGAFIQNLLLILHARGYGACWIGFAKWDALNNIHVEKDRQRAFNKYFSLNEEQIPVSLIAMGRPAVAPNAPSRQAIDNIVIDRCKKGG